VMDAMESMATSMYQVWVEKLMQLPLRAEAAALAARSGRHSAKVATVATGAPDAYISPAVLGEEVLPDETGLIPLYAIPSQYGSLSPYMLVIGAASAAGTRFTLPIETPSDNSYVYVSESCPA